MEPISSQAQSRNTPFAGALYYPYIHITDVDWLRANLLIFPHVQRMMPRNFAPDRDHPAVRSFAEARRGDVPLLTSANLDSGRSISAQETLRERLLMDVSDPAFAERYGQAATRAEVTPDDLGFQIHRQKLRLPIVEILEQTSLAWAPAQSEASIYAADYVEVHPRIGEAVMSTLAIACAQAAGLHIVGDQRSGALHDTLIQKDLTLAYDAWLHPERISLPPSDASATRLFEYVVGFPADVSSLSAKKILELTADREPIDALLGALARDASRIAAMDAGPAQDAAFKDAADDVFTRWQADRRNLSKSVRRFFGRDSGKLATDFTKQMTEKAVTGAVAGAGASKAATVATHTVAAAHAGWHGALASGILMGAAAGLMVGLIAHGVTTYLDAGRREKESPYRFLTTLQEAGVVFRASVA